MNPLKKFNEDKYILAALFIFAIIIRLIVFVQSGDQTGDGMYRRILTINWLKEPLFITGGLWPPLHLYLMAFMMALLKDPQISTRMVSLLLGIFIIFPYYYLVKLLFDRNVAITSTLILVFLSLHIQYSTLSMSEVPFIFFLFTSLYFFYIFRTTKQNDRLFYLTISAFFLNFASMIRYEAWLFIPILTIFTLIGIRDKNKLFSIEKKAIGYLFVFLIISLIFPTLWMIGNYQLHGDFLYPQNWSDHWIKTNAMLNSDHPLNKPFINKIILWPAFLSSTFWPLNIGSFKSINIISILAGFGLVISFLKKKNLDFLTIFFILMLIFTYKLLNFTMLPQIRHILFLSLFLIPYISIGLEYVLQSLNKNGSKIITIVILLSFISVSSYSAIAKNAYITPDYVFDVSNWMKENIKPGERILIDEYNWWGLHILFYSGFNTTFIEDYDKNFEFVTDQVRIVRGGGKRINDSTIISYLDDYRPLYLVYSPKGKLTGILNFSSGCHNEVKFNHSFECKYTTKNYNIYRLKKLI